ncbi:MULTISPECIES: NADH-quinone oxidoreductase subunit N [unclassified Corallococcus]|uniref:NADH-quinone oxidoreductase subunit N n=1 Tax=unclassified Corallococcus TaxID=2685029 RepID=UPI001A8E8E30|nr:MULTISPECIES: NADH-quinone oxidoreductase subunit N [unclassified Corallococcus]MBN9688186.1 NADH-quinone oxidoreductase subunit N [Corallococcus sp. NCSPR001]WAS88008.1 NADH-quinone oxidoreductase subunit N [Corallococcus sp. NCRR]
MNLPNLTLADFLPMLPAIIMVVAASVLLLSEVFLSATASRGYQAVLTVVAAVASGAVAVGLMFEPPQEVFLGFGVLDPFSSFLTLVVSVGLGLAALSAVGFLRKRGAERGEFYALMLFASAGMSLLAMSSEFITIFVNIEVLSIATYALTAYLRRGTRPSEAGFKYFILGAFSSAILLYGTALLYGATGTTKLNDIAGPLQQALSTNPALVYVGAVLIAAGFAFKVAAVPFHMWTPDVYEGAPTPVTALMSAGVKAAAFASLVRVFVTVGKGMDPKLPLMLFATLALLTMIAGNLMAIPQRNVKRMLAYSSIAHAGYLLLGVAALFVAAPGEHFRLLSASSLSGGTPLDVARSDALRGILYYLLAYTFSAAGAFAMVSALERREDEEKGTAWDLERFAGLAQRRPGWAFAMAAFMLSLGGIPPTVGFMSKLLIFQAAIDVGLVGLTVVAVLSSAAGAYYYLRVVVYMFMHPVPEGAQPLERNWGTEAALVIATVAVVLLGILPGHVTDWLAQAGTLFGQ